MDVLSTALDTLRKAVPEDKRDLLDANLEHATEWKVGDETRTQPEQVVIVAKLPGKARRSWTVKATDKPADAEAKVRAALEAIGVETKPTAIRGDDWATVDPEADTAALEAP